MSKIKTYKVTGTDHYLKNIMELASENLDFDYSKKELIDAGYEDERIYKYDFYINKFELVPDPTNEYDPNAIKVLADNIHIGYIKSGSCKHLNKVIAENRIEKIDGKIGGGKYKYIGYDDDTEKYFMDKGETSFFVDLYISEL